MPASDHEHEIQVENGHANGRSKAKTSQRRADEVDELIDAVKTLIVPYIRAADEAAPVKATGRPQSDTSGRPWNALVDPLSPQDLIQRLKFSLPQNEGRGKDGLMQAIHDVLQYSVNTWDQGFMDKLTASTNAVGVISEMVLGVLNTNVHVYHVSPALTVIEKITARTLASYFGFNGPRLWRSYLSGWQRV